MSVAPFALLTNEDEKAQENRDLIKIPLKPHQRTLLAAAIKLETEEHSVEIKEHGGYMSPAVLKTKLGVICDKVGSGKSLVVSSIIANNPYIETTIPESKTFMETISAEFTERRIPTIPINVIVVPHTIISQWKGYLTDHTNMKFYTITKNKDFEKWKTDFGTIVDNHVILLVSNSRFSQLSDWFAFNNSHLKISRLFIDEADSINLPSFYPIRNNFTWVITSSWNTLKNPHGKKYWVNLDGQISSQYNYMQGFVYPEVTNKLKNTGFLKSFFSGVQQLETMSRWVNKLIYLKNEDSYVDSSFSLEIPILHKIICENPVIINILNDIVDQSLINMINAGNTEGAIEKMKCVKTGSENLLSLVTKDITNEIENKKLEYDAKSKMHYSSPKSKKESLEKITAKIQELEMKKKMITQRISENDMCSICFDTATNPTILNCCQSSYCFECVSRWMASSQFRHKPPTCPNCRAPITKSNMIVVSEKACGCEGGGAPAPKKLKNKLDNMFDIITKRKAEGGRMKSLIFSEHDIRDYSVKLESFLTDSNIKFAYLKGTSATIKKTIEDYKTGDLDCLLMNARYCGSGINLENTSDIFIYHSMSTELTQQVIGRAQRPGRDSCLNVWMLLHENEAV